MPNEAIKEASKEAAVTRERRPGSRLASQEFFYLVERIDRLDEKLTGKIESEVKTLSGRIDALDTKLTGKIESEIRTLNGRIDSLDTKLTGKIESLDTKLTGKIESEVKSLNDKIEKLDEKFSGEIRGLNVKLDSISSRAIGQVVAIVVGFAGVIVTLIMSLR